MNQMILWKNAQIHTNQKVVSSMITDKGKIIALGDTLKILTLMQRLIYMVCMFILHFWIHIYI